MDEETIFYPTHKSTPSTPYTMITPYLALGSLYSRYNTFDVIVNMSYFCDGDGFKRHDITTTVNQEGKTVIRVGIYDMPTEPLDIILPRLIPVLIAFLSDRKRILVHCQAGKSRSSSVVIALVSVYLNIPYAESLALVQSIRPIVQPNQGFARMTEEYVSAHYANTVASEKFF